MSTFTDSQTNLLRSFTDSGYLIKPRHYLEDQLAFYGAYHSVFGNKLVHFIFVPILLITGSALPLMFFSEHVTFVYIIWTLMYPISYIYIDFKTGISWIPMASFTLFMANMAKRFLSPQTVFIVFVISFVIQIISHYVIEKRKPAFLDSLYQSLVLAPFFIWFELVVYPLGFCKDIKLSVKEKIREIQGKMDNKKHE